MQVFQTAGVPPNRGEDHFGNHQFNKKKQSGTEKKCQRKQGGKRCKQ